MNLTVGRVTLPDTGVSWDQSNGGVRVSGTSDSLTRAQAVTLREQLLGYVENPDESFVSVTSTSEPDLDGFYRVTAAQVTGSGYDAYSGRTQWSVDLERVTGYRSARIEVSSVGGYRLNSHSWGVPTSGTLVVWLPPTARATRLVKNGTELTHNIPMSVSSIAKGVESDSLTGATQISYAVDPGAFYTAAATITRNNNLVVGRLGAISLGDIVLSNGLAEARISIISGDLTISTRWWTGSTWDAWRTYQVRSIAVSHASAGPVTILRNSPEAVSVRVDVGSQVVRSLDLTLRRGELFVTGVIAAMSPNQARIYSAEASGGSLSAGVYTKSNQAFASPQPLTVTGGYFTPTSSQVAWGFAIGPSAATGSGMAMPYRFASSQRQAVVAR